MDPPASPSPIPGSGISSPIPSAEANELLLDSPLARSRSASASPEPDIPLTMTASALLADLPRDATAALASAQTFPPDSKVVVRFKAVGGGAPPLARDVCKITAGRRFEEVVRYLRRKLRCRETDSVFLYVNSVFAPSLDEVVGNLHQCFKNGNDQLVVAYSMTPAFG